ncbi:ribonuclease III domain-containing protein [Apodospora peruviana]|uniref:Large ribosomal subunit protein mL44 n=1 Tax=Apodospora peruviana TaxID=516989 RepID=A0AAE0I4X0_9PEZI|nr:ribonuclease III domain-containing protein [Apodospora peruviana]
MKRLRPASSRWTGWLLVARPGALRSAQQQPVSLTLRRQQSTSTATAPASYNTQLDGTDHDRFPPLEPLPPSATSLPSPLPERALRSAKLAALHARLSLPKKLPLQTLARTLVDASADENPKFNNANLAFVGQTLINYHIAEWIMVRYPRLPMAIIWAAMLAYTGPAPLHQVARSWGIESAAVPGGEVDPGLLQYSLEKPGTAIRGFGYKREELDFIDKYKFRQSINSGVIFDDDYGNLIRENAQRQRQEEQDAMDANYDESIEPDHMSYGNEATRSLAENAHANFTRAVVGAIYAHCGRDAVKAFIKSHIMSRTLDFSKLFEFKNPTRELNMLCEREDFDPPIARMLSETGRLSRTPVYVVGIFSGNDKLGEAVGPSLDMARLKAAMNSLKSWYLYSPGGNARLPSDMLAPEARPWQPAYIDIGEVVAR